MPITGFDTFYPAGIDKTTKLRNYISDLCRSVDLEYVQENKEKWGLRSLRFKISDSNFYTDK